MYEKGTVETRYKAEKPCATLVVGAKNDAAVAADADATITRGSFYRAKIINVFNGRAPQNNVIRNAYCGFVLRRMGRRKEKGVFRGRLLFFRNSRTRFVLNNNNVTFIRAGIIWRLKIRAAVAAAVAYPTPIPRLNSKHGIRIKRNPYLAFCFRDRGPFVATDRPQRHRPAATPHPSATFARFRLVRFPDARTSSTIKKP